MLLRAKMVERAGDYAWSSFAFHGEGRADPLWTRHRAMTPWPRMRRFDSGLAYVQQEAEEEELAAIRRSGETGLPYGEKMWVDRLCRRLKLDLTIRPCGRPRKDVDPNGKKYCTPLFPLYSPGSNSRRTGRPLGDEVFLDWPRGSCRTCLETQEGRAA